MATPEEFQTHARRKRVEVGPRYESADKALQAKHEQMAEYLKGDKLDHLKTLRPTKSEH